MLVCEAYIEGKQHRVVFFINERGHVIKPLKTDVCGPINTTSMGGTRVFEKNVGKLIEVKESVLIIFKEFKAVVGTHSEHKIRKFCWDDSGSSI